MDSFKKWFLISVYILIRVIKVILFLGKWIGLIIFPVVLFIIIYFGIRDSFHNLREFIMMLHQNYDGFQRIIMYATYSVLTGLVSDILLNKFSYVVRFYDEYFEDYCHRHYIY